MKSIVKAGFVGAFALAAATASAQNADISKEQAQQAIETRQSIFHLQGWAMGPLGGMLKRQIEFDAELAKKSGQRIANLAPMITDAFKTDTRGFDIETEALDTIWDNKDDFAKKADRLIKAANELVAAAESGNQGKTLKAAAVVGKACGACHDAYRED
jgi:cytochrome c556